MDTNASEALVTPIAGSITHPAGPKCETSERLSRWSKRWSDSKIGWHADEVNHALLKHGGTIVPFFSVEPDENPGNCVDTGEKVRILVPLCGKSVDMAFLAKQSYVAEVVGVEGVRMALNEFSSDHPDLSITEMGMVTGERGSFEKFVGKDIALLKGDFFELDELSSAGRVDAVWDRASIVAIRPELRQEYVRTIGRVMKPGGTVLALTIDKRTGTDEARERGPPFSLDEAEMKKLYEKEDWVESVTVLDEFDEFARDPGAAERHKGVTNLYEVCFVVKAKE